MSAPTQSLYEQVLRDLARAAAAGGSGHAAMPPPRASAAVVPWRRLPSGALEVYWVERSPSLPFMGGWHAFPGGGLARTDAQVPLAGTPRGLGAGPAAAGLPESLRDAVETVGPD